MFEMQIKSRRFKGKGIDDMFESRGDLKERELIMC